MDQQRFAALARSVFTERSQLRSIAAAPNLIVSLVYPLEQNRRALGLDYRKNEAQRAAVMRVKDTGQMVLAGPVDLVQGGKGLIGRFPVSIDAGGGSNRFWGIVSAMLARHGEAPADEERIDGIHFHRHAARQRGHAHGRGHRPDRRPAPQRPGRPAAHRAAAE